MLQKHRGTISLYQQQLVTALVLCLVAAGQTNDPRQAALAALHQLLQIEHDSLALDTDGQSCLLLRLKTAHSEWWGEHTAGFIDMHRTTLCLIGRAGTKTAPHADWADARNFAVAIGQKV